MLEITDNKIDFVSIFKKFISSAPKHSYIDSIMDYNDDSYFDSGLMGDCWGETDWYDEYQSYKKKKKDRYNGNDFVWDRKQGKFVPKSEYGKYSDDDDDYTCSRGSKKTKKQHKKKEKETYSEDFIDVNQNKSFSDINDFTYNREDKIIYFYEDVTKQDKFIKFKSLYALDAYVSKENIYVTQSDVQYLMKNQLIHCATITDKQGEKVLVTDNSYGGLVWSTCELEKMYETETWD